MRIKTFLVSAVLTISTILSANVRIANIFGDNMVLQRNSEITIWGWANPGENISVSLGKKNKGNIVAGKDSTWVIKLDKMEAGGPYSLIVKGDNEIVINNILIGDVWVCGGQSNMEYQIYKFGWANEEIKNANYQNIRLLTVPRNYSTKPVSDIKKSEWKEAVGNNISDFSAVGYFFGKNIHIEENVPIGLISSNWGGTNVEAWSSIEAVKKNENVYNAYQNIKAIDQNTFTKLDLIDSIKNLTKNDIGLENKWYSPETSKNDWENIIIPLSLNNNYSPNDFKQKVVWYSTTFSIPYIYRNKNLKFSLNKLNDYNTIWVNGIKIMETYSPNDWATFIVNDSILKNEENELVVRTAMFSQNDDAMNMNPLWYNFYPVASSEIYTPLAGEWKTKTGLTFKEEIDLPKLQNERDFANNCPSSLFNGMISPITKMNIKGAIWYQGESNAKRAYDYRTLFPNMIIDWREKFNSGDFPFIYVQLANFRKPVDTCAESEWAELREAQNEALKLPKVGMACAIDLGEAGNIHPQNKQEVGRRLALSAEKVAYNKELEYSGPMFESVEFKEGKAYIKFSNTGSGLVAHDKYSYLKGFCIAAEDKIFTHAKAEIKGDTVIVWNESISKPIAVRYAWAENPIDANLYNIEGLPASPFRTDNWKGITEGNKYYIEKK